MKTLKSLVVPLEKINDHFKIVLKEMYGQNKTKRWFEGSITQSILNMWVFL